MNTRKSSRKNYEDFSYASAASTSRISSEGYSSCYDGEDTISEDDDDLSLIEYKLERLKGTYYEKKLRNTGLKRCMEVKNVSTFVNDLICNKESKDTTSEEQKRVIKELYERNKDLFKRVKHVQKVNKAKIKEIFSLYESVQDLTEERKKLWAEAVKILRFNLGDASAFLNFDESEQLNESSNKIKDKDKDLLIRGMDIALVSKSFQIIRVAQILYNLISNSEVNWSKDENLLEILHCASKILDRDFDLKNRAKCMKTVDEITHRLNKIKI